MIIKSMLNLLIGIFGLICVGCLIAAFFNDWDADFLMGAFLSLFIAGVFSQITEKLDKKEKQKLLEEKRRMFQEKQEEQERIRQEEYLKSPEYKEKLLSEELVAKRVLLLERLTDISGVTDKVARTLLDQFPTEESIKDASVEDLSDIPGIGDSVARAIKARLG